jgi:hypothetical protein
MPNHGNVRPQRENWKQLVQQLEHECDPARIVMLAKLLIAELNLIHAKERLKPS